LQLIEPGKPTQNASIESFNGKFRDECLNQNFFVSSEDARGMIEDWPVGYNTVRPHSALRYQTPDTFPAQAAGKDCGEDISLATSRKPVEFPLSHSPSHHHHQQQQPQVFPPGRQDCSTSLPEVASSLEQMQGQGTCLWAGSLPQLLPCVLAILLHPLPPLLFSSAT